MFYSGQRYFSESEPELGLGVILEVDASQVEVLFTATETRRVYVADSAPLKRVSLRVGQSIDEDFKIYEIQERNNCYVYINDRGHEYLESELPDQMSMSGAEDRLFSGSLDDHHLFDLRRRTLEIQYEQLKSPIYGFQGAKLDLLPHQFYVAKQVCDMPKPRVLLSDEVGLGKTIEAGLILHRLLMSGDVKRILILLPDALQNQWFVEMYRKFNLWFSLIDEERFKAVSVNGENPFLQDPLVICSTDFASSKAKVSEAMVQGEWDLLIVDEAHHLEWSINESSAAYSMVEAVAALTPRLVLLTATPDQLGEESHFARLRLLDPDRFYDLKSFQEEQVDYRERVAGIDSLLESESFSDEQMQLCQQLLGEDHFLMKQIKTKKLDAEVRRKLLKELIDRHGTSRVIFRNTRKVMKNFPVRCPQGIELIEEAKSFQESPDLLALMDEDLFADPAKTQKVKWLCEKLQEKPDEKFLLICSSRKKAEAIEAGIRQHMELKMALFHEGLTLNNRDRNAVFFAQEARLLICSEIGSEGRNFQFCHNLILFDLPKNPGLLEQRIGRLDRIGQSQDIQIYYFYRKNSPEEALSKFYAEGLDAFARPLHGGEKMTKVLLPYLDELIHQYAEHLTGVDKAMKALLDMAQATAKEVHEQLEQGRDHLLELYSFDKEIGEGICQSIQTSDADRQLENYLEGFFDYLGVAAHDVEDEVYKVEPGQNLISDLPGLSAEGSLMSLQRSISIQREDLQYLSWEHPLVRSGMDMILSGETGNSSFALCLDPSSRSILLESVMVLECLLPARTGINRFLPPRPIFIRVDHRGRESSDDQFYEEAELEKGDAYRLLDKDPVRENLLPEMIRVIAVKAQEKAEQICQQAVAAADEYFLSEISRLESLSEKNQHIQSDEVEILKSNYALLKEEIPKARLRQDSLRLIWKGAEDYLG